MVFFGGCSSVVKDDVLQFVVLFSTLWSGFCVSANDLLVHVFLMKIGVSLLNI
ncbi:hypothetical protein Hdeb2414_s0006g00193041 [Helianthus debilis subsp. tardiflorus]